MVNGTRGVMLKLVPRYHRLNLCGCFPIMYYTSTKFSMYVLVGWFIIRRLRLIRLYRILLLPSPTSRDFLCSNA
eukprot:SAG31_NODE_18948_length_617_cov_0.471042_1_plen_73_part_10